MGRLFLRPEARADLAEAFKWYKERRTGAGYDFLHEARAVLASIEQNPRQYPITLEDIRKAPLRRFPYIVYFIEIETDVSVLAVMHGRRHPHKWQQRR